MTEADGLAGPYQPTWDSLAGYEVPDWYQDAKLGIFVHWGVYAVPAFDNEWYPRNMYQRDHPVFAQHRERWGPQSEFGYKDFIPMFRAERWDPQAWVELFARAGARYVVPVAEHHDGFPMYDCRFTGWSAARMGPRRDVIAELERVVRSRGLKFGVSSHRAFNWRYYAHEPEFDTSRAEYAGLYGACHPEGMPASEEFIADWFGRTKELIDRFRPDVLWFDFGWHEEEFAPYRPQVAAYYYNRAHEWGKGVVLNYKDTFPEGTAVLDIERGKLEDIREHYWQTDTSVSWRSWGYLEDDELKEPATIIHDLADIVSKNGNLLLNVGPRPDGTIPEEVERLLLAVGEWLRVNGEAIYGARPWRRFGEGPTAVTPGHMKEREAAAFTSEDVRFTRRGDHLYAICLGWAEREWRIGSLASAAGRVKSVAMLGSREQVRWRQAEDGLRIAAPTSRPCDHAYVFRVGLAG